MVNSSPPEDPAPPIAGTADLLQQVIAQNQELVRLLSAKDGKSGRKNTNGPPNTSTVPRQIQPPHPITAYLGKYYWTYGQGSHKVGDFHSKAVGHKYKAKIYSMMDRSKYGCT